MAMARPRDPDGRCLGVAGAQSDGMTTYLLLQKSGSGVTQGHLHPASDILEGDLDSDDTVKVVAVVGSHDSQL